MVRLQLDIGEPFIRDQVWLAERRARLAEIEARVQIEYRPVPKPVCRFCGGKQISHAIKPRLCRKCGLENWEAEKCISVQDLANSEAGADT